MPMALKIPHQYVCNNSIYSSGLQCPWRNDRTQYKVVICPYIINHRVGDNKNPLPDELLMCEIFVKTCQNLVIPLQKTKK